MLPGLRIKRPVQRCSQTRIGRVFICTPARSGLARDEREQASNMRIRDSPDGPGSVPTFPRFAAFDKVAASRRAPPKCAMEHGRPKPVSGQGKSQNCIPFGRVSSEVRLAATRKATQRLFKRRRDLVASREVEGEANRPFGSEFLVRFPRTERSRHEGISVTALRQKPGADVRHWLSYWFRSKPALGCRGHYRRSQQQRQRVGSADAESARRHAVTFFTWPRIFFRIPSLLLGRGMILRPRWEIERCCM